MSRILREAFRLPVEAQSGPLGDPGSSLAACRM